MATVNSTATLNGDYTKFSYKNVVFYYKNSRNFIHHNHKFVKGFLQNKYFCEF